MNFASLFEALKAYPYEIGFILFWIVAVPNIAWWIFYLCKKDEERQAWKQVNALEEASQKENEKAIADLNDKLARASWHSGLRKLHIGITVQKAITEFITDVTDGKNAQTQANRLCEVFAILYDPWDQSEFQNAHGILLEKGAAFKARMDVVLSGNKKVMVVSAIWIGTDGNPRDVSRRFYTNI